VYRENNSVETNREKREKWKTANIFIFFRMSFTKRKRERKWHDTRKKWREKKKTKRKNTQKKLFGDKNTFLSGGWWLFNIKYIMVCACIPFYTRTTLTHSSIPYKVNINAFCHRNTCTHNFHDFSYTPWLESKKRLNFKYFDIPADWTLAAHRESKRAMHMLKKSVEKHKKNEKPVLYLYMKSGAPMSCSGRGEKNKKYKRTNMQIE